VLYAFDWAADKVRTAFTCASEQLAAALTANPISQDVVAAYVNLLLNLISSDVSHLAPSFQMIARNFLPRKSQNSLGTFLFFSSAFCLSLLVRALLVCRRRALDSAIGPYVQSDLAVVK
jgi:hypothetical protein